MLNVILFASLFFFHSLSFSLVLSFVPHFLFFHFLNAWICVNYRTVVSLGDGANNQESTKEQIFENIRLHKEVLQSVKMQPWSMRRKLRLVRQVCEYAKNVVLYMDRYSTWIQHTNTNAIWYKLRCNHWC